MIVQISNIYEHHRNDCVNSNLPICYVCRLGIDGTDCYYSYYKNYYVPIYCSNKIDIIRCLKTYQNVDEAYAFYFRKALLFYHPDIEQFMILM